MDFYSVVFNYRIANPITRGLWSGIWCVQAGSLNYEIVVGPNLSLAAPIIGSAARFDAYLLESRTKWSGQG